MYRLVQGSIFDRKCDLVIIPCNNYGGITRSIADDLIAYGLNFPSGILNPGDIAFEVSPEYFVLSSNIGYAAAVAIKDVNHNFTADSLHHIADKIIEYCKNNSLRLVNIPLLGTGAGGMSVTESFEIIKAHFEKTPYVTANIFALSQNVYNILNEPSEQNALKAQPEASPEQHPRVFISYCSYDNENREWAKNLYQKLRKNGVDAIIDMYHIRLGHYLPQWMTNEIIMADKVLLICDKHYMSRADDHRGGVGWETMIIQGDMMANLDIDKYICIMREKNPNESLPFYMRSKYALDCPEEDLDEDKFAQLLKAIFSCDESVPIGDIPPYIKGLLPKNDR